MATSNPDNAAFRAFLRRVWQHDVSPLLRGRRQAQRTKSARVAGKAAAATGLFVDGVFGLRGKPFTRFLTVVGSSLGAMLPDVWDWRWLREDASEDERRTVDDVVGRRAAELPHADALALFGLTPAASRAALQDAWRAAAQRWHPDKAPRDADRAEYHTRFIAHQAAYERLVAAYDRGELPRAEAD